MNEEEVHISKQKITEIIKLLGASREILRGDDGKSQRHH